MPEPIQPIFTKGFTTINGQLGFECRDNTVTYYYGVMPVFSHDKSDIKTFHMISAQFYINGNAKQADIARATGIPLITLKRAVKTYREGGPKAFYQEPKRGGPRVLTPDVVDQAENLFDNGKNVGEVAEELSLKKDTLQKAINSGRVKKKIPVKSETLSTKSARSVEDSKAPMGMGATNTMERLATSIGGKNGADPSFQNCADVPNGGVLFALPALLVQGLLNHTNEHFKLPKGFYTLNSIFLLISFMALSRVKFIEGLKHEPPGEWGKLLGFDRVPEARTMREKISKLSEEGEPEKWSAEMSKQWINQESSAVGVFYLDGHVRVYHGNQTKLPYHYVSRDKLCARATCDYWVNAMNGEPFFYVSQAVDPGLPKILENEIIPRLEKEIDKQPTKEELEANPLLPRFTMIVDREGYSPKSMARLWKKRIAVQTYSKYNEEIWDMGEFNNYTAKMPSGETIDLKLAERCTLIGTVKGRSTKIDSVVHPRPIKKNTAVKAASIEENSNAKEKPIAEVSAVWVREIRRLRSNNVQGSMVTTNFNINLADSFVWLISRWSQENFFGYMKKEFNLDRLIDYELEDVSDTVKLINPKYRKEDSTVRKYNSKLNRLQKNFGAITFDEEIDPEAVEKYQQKKSEMLKEIGELKTLVEKHKSERKKHPRHVLFRDLDEEEKFQQLRSSGKHMIDTIKMVAYRAETSMASIIKEKMSFHEHSSARVLLRDIYNTEADLIVNEENKTLTVRLHHLANRHSDEIVSHLCKELNETKIEYPGTNYRLVYELVS